MAVATEKKMLSFPTVAFQKFSQEKNEHCRGGSKTDDGDEVPVAQQGRKSAKDPFACFFAREKRNRAGVLTPLGR